MIPLLKTKKKKEEKYFNYYYMEAWMRFLRSILVFPYFI